MSEYIGSVIGAAYADALGKSTEFMMKHDIQMHYKLQYKTKTMKLGISNNDEHRNTWDLYDWTDDTDQSILVFQSIKESIDLNSSAICANDSASLFAKKLYYWYYHGFPEFGDTAGCGIGTPVRWVILHPSYITNPKSASYDIWKSSDGCLCEDGAIMRTWIIGVFDFTKDLLISLATEICQITHYDPRAVAACIYITLCVNSFIYKTKDVNKVMRDAQEAAEEFIMTASYLNDSELSYTRDVYLNKFRKYIGKGNRSSLEDLKLDKPNSRSNTKNPLICAVYAMCNIELGYDAIIQHIVFQGGDSDTNACVSGAVLGAYFGLDGISEDYRKLKYLDFLINNIVVNK